MLSIADLLPILSLQNNKEFLYSLEKKIDKHSVIKLLTPQKISTICKHSYLAIDSSITNKYFHK